MSMTKILSRQQRLPGTKDGSSDFLILSNVINPKSDTKCEWIRDAGLLISGQSTGAHGGKILACMKSKRAIRLMAQNPTLEVIDCRQYAVMPGLFDMHFHWVQDDVREMPKEALLSWLSKYTWPAEHKFKQRNYALKKAQSFSQALLQAGTLGGGCYGSIHSHSVECAMENFVGDFIIGNVLMTMNSPDYLTQSKQEAIDSVKSLGKKYLQRYAVTPRFAPTVHMDVMQEVSKIGRRQECFIQSHLCETKQEIEYVLELFNHLPQIGRPLSKFKSYSEIYQRAGLLGEKTIMGHGIHLSPTDSKILHQTNTALAHCPTSNAPLRYYGLGSGLFDFKQAEKHKLRWALASDIGAGPFLSMFDVMNFFVHLNRHASPTTYTKALYRSTQAAADILQIGHQVGNIEVGKFANLIFVPSPKWKGDEDGESVLRKIIQKRPCDRHLYQDLVAKTMYHGKFVQERD